MVTISFNTPVTVLNKTYSEIEINEPTIGQLKKAQQTMAANPGVAGETGFMMTLAQLISGLPIQAIEQLVVSDFTQVAEAIASGERLTFPVYIKAIVPDIGPEIVAKFTLTLSLKLQN